MLGLEVGREPEDFGVHVGGRAVAGRGVVEGPRFGLGLGNQVGHRLEAPRGRDQHVGQGRERCHTREILQRVVAEVGIQRRIDQMARRLNQQGQTIGGGLGDDAGPERAARPRTVLDDHAGAQRRAQRIDQQTGEHIGATAGGEWHDQANDLPGWPGTLRGGWQAGGGPDGRTGRDGQQQAPTGRNRVRHGQAVRRGQAGGLLRSVHQGLLQFRFGCDPSRRRTAIGPRPPGIT